MAINPEDLLDLAKSLHGQAKESEAYRRSAISRYYYAMYHKVHSILEQEPLDYNKGCHENLIKYLKNEAQHDEPHDFRILVRLAESLRQERDRRNNADYQLDESIHMGQVDLCQSTAELLFEQANGLAQSSSASRTG